MSLKHSRIRGGCLSQPLLCRLGLHKWRNFGKQVLITWQEPGMLPLVKKEMRKYVFCERECLRCGISEKRKFLENIDGTLGAAGWDKVKSEKDQK